MRRSPLALFAAAVAFLLPVVFSPSVHATFWTPAAALCLVVAGVGLPLALRLARLERAALAAVAFAATACLSALVSGAGQLAWTGLHNWGTGALFVLALVGAWAVGRHAAGDGASVVEQALLMAVLVNAVVAILETGLDLSPFKLGLYGGRAPGLFGNPIHLGTFAGGGLALLAPRFGRSAPAWSAAVVAVAASVQVSGSRFALVVAVGVVAWAVWTLRARRAAAVAFVALVLAGFVAAQLLGSLQGGVSVTERVAAAAGNGITPRVETWKGGFEAWTEKPLLGWGPGRFAAAASPHRTVALVRAEAPDKLFVDAHNIVVEYLTTTGAVGVAALAAWMVLASRRARGPLFVFALALLANHLVEPQSVRTTPVAFLALGAAAPAARRAGTRAATIAIAAGAAAATAAAAVLLVGDFHLEQGRLDFDLAHARAADRLLPSWPESATLLGRIHLFRWKTEDDPAELDRALAWFREATARAPWLAPTWNSLAENLSAAGRYHAALDAFERALADDPVSLRALNGIAITALHVGDRARAAVAFRRSITIDPEQASFVDAYRDLGRRRE